MRVPATAVLPGVLAAAFSTALPIALAGAQDWTLRPHPPSPPPATFPRMAYDVARSRCVRFGGWNAPLGTIVFHDTWEWDGNNWLLRAPATVPTERDDHAMVYDLAHARTLMFGG